MSWLCRYDTAERIELEKEIGQILETKDESPGNEPNDLLSVFLAELALSSDPCEQLSADGEFEGEVVSVAS